MKNFQFQVSFFIHTVVVVYINIMKTTLDFNFWFLPNFQTAWLQKKTWKHREAVKKSKLKQKSRLRCFDFNAVFKRIIVKRNCVFSTDSDFLIPISLQPNVVDLRYFQIQFCITPSGCTYIGIIKSLFINKQVFGICSNF